MAENRITTVNITTERIRSAAKHLEEDCRRVQSVSPFANLASLYPLPDPNGFELGFQSLQFPASDLTGNTLYFKMVAEEMEREHNSEAVATLRQGLLEVLDCAHRLEFQCLALQKLSQSFEAGEEEMDFSKHLDESTRQLLSENPFDPTKDKLYHQFDRAIWNIHHAGEAAPGQEEEEIVVINDSGVRNNKCPLTGKPVFELENPVRSVQCHHIYEQRAVMEYIAKAGRRRCKCAVAGCPADLKKDNFKNDASLNMEIQEFRLRDRATQLENYTELEDELDLSN